MSEITTEPLERFIARVRRASVSGGKNINMTIEEATELTASMALIMLAKLQVGQETSKEEDQEVTIHGGGFK